MGCFGFTLGQSREVGRLSEERMVEETISATMAGQIDGGGTSRRFVQPYCEYILTPCENFHKVLFVQARTSTPRLSATPTSQPPSGDLKDE